MANTNYNTIVTKVVVNPDGTTSGLKSVEDQVNSFAGRMRGAFANATSHAGQMGNAINAVAIATNTLNQSSLNWLGTLTNIGAGFAMGGGIGAGIGAISALANYMSNARDRTNELAAEMEEAINMANTFGITFRQFSDIKMAGLVEGVNPESMSKLLIAAGEVLNDPEKLGDIGLSKAQIAGKSHYDQIMMVIDAWKQAMEAAGGYSDVVKEQVGKKGFASLAPLIALGSEGIAKSARENLSVPEFMAAELDKASDELTKIAEEKKRDEARQAWWAKRKGEQSWWLRTFSPDESDRLIGEQLGQELQLEVIRDVRKQKEQLKRQADAKAAKAAEYSFSSNPWEYGPFGNEPGNGAYMMAQLVASEQRNNLSKFKPVRSTLAGSLDPTSFSGAAELQKILSREGGGEKSVEERLMDANAATAKEAKKTADNTTKMLELQQRGIVVVKAPEF